MLLQTMASDTLAPREHVIQLRESLAEHYGRVEYLRCESMGALIRENLESVRLNIESPILTPMRPDEVE
jgi:hypothetical protein